MDKRKEAMNNIPRLMKRLFPTWNLRHIPESHSLSGLSARTFTIAGKIVCPAALLLM
jgi:hypothetical protein